MSLSKKDLEFEQAMKTKLRLNREQLSQEGSESSVQSKEQSETVGENFRESMIQEGLEEFPGLTREKAQKMLEEMGF